MPQNSKDQVKDIFDKLQRNPDPGKFTREKAVQAADWYRKKIRNLGGFTYHEAIKTLQHKFTPSVFIGKMFMYVYDPKWKLKLPWYDIFPLVIPIDMYSDGFLGLNLHYLSPPERVYLLKRLLDFATDKRMDENTKLKVSYGFLKGVAKYKAATPCIKRYLSDHIRSSIIQIDAPEWETAVFLPLEQFRKSGKESVWSKNRTWKDKKPNYTKVKRK